MRVVVVGGTGRVGSDQIRLHDLVRRVLEAEGDRRSVIEDPSARYFGAKLGERDLLSGADARIGPTRLDDWIARSRVTGSRSSSSTDQAPTA